MSLYYETAALLSNPERTGGSLKSRIYKQQGLKSSPAQVFALASEASKWSPLLKDVIERCGFLREEKKLSPILALLLTYDLLVSKRGVAAPANHVLKLAIQRHKARLAAEFTKSRVRSGYATLDALRAAVVNGQLDKDQEDEKPNIKHPRWVRVNTLKTTMQQQLDSTFAGFAKEESLSTVSSLLGSTKAYFRDVNIPNLLALPPKVDLTQSAAYTNGEIIFQDKASCFPAYLLDIALEDGNIIDGCAAPGNKTTHLAAIVSEQRPTSTQPKVIAFERDKARASTLQKMVKLASADHFVSVKASADFLAAKPDSEEFSNVGAILLDPSCSGSGIVGRDEAIRMHLPSPFVGTVAESNGNKSKKRKRAPDSRPVQKQDTTLSLALDDSASEETVMEGKRTERLTALSAFQLRILTHAMRFPKARKITYSTCSIHFEENEGVVARALNSSVAKERGWTILARDLQVEGLKSWTKRGIWEQDKLMEGIEIDDSQKEKVCDACIRCEKGTEEGTMGFFAAAFVRDDAQSEQVAVTKSDQPDMEVSEEEWHGFSDIDNDNVEVVAEQVVATKAERSQKRKKAKRK